MQTRLIMRGATFTAIAAALALTYGALHPTLSPSAHAATPTQAAQGQALLPNFSDLVERVAPAVVNIRTSKNTVSAGEADSPFSDPLPPGMPRMPFRGAPDGPPAQGIGSGFVITPDGYVLTNAHVVDGADELIVTLEDEREFKAKVIGLDKRTDVALLKIDASNLTAVKIGDPSKTKVGEWVAAIGAPFGLDHTVTAGIVSAKSRSLPHDSYVPFIQTDVAVNPGNSGGPLFNLNGEVIGINSQIYSRTGGFMGLSFAIPIDVAMKVKEELQLHGKVTRGRIGVVIQDVSKELADSFGMAKAEGALVNSVDKSAPAAAAGLQPGDVILKVDGKPVAKAGDASRFIGEMKPGQTAKLEIWRSGAKKEVSLVLAELPSDTVASASESAPPQKLGVVVRDLTEQERQKLGEKGGVVVEQSSGPAAKAGIRRGDVILSFNNKPVTDASELKRLVDSAAGKRAALLVERDGSRLFLPVTLG